MVLINLVTILPAQTRLSVPDRILTHMDGFNGESVLVTSETLFVSDQEEVTTRLWLSGFQGRRLAWATPLSVRGAIETAELAMTGDGDFMLAGKITRIRGSGESALVLLHFSADGQLRGRRLFENLGDATTVSLQTDSFDGFALRFHHNPPGNQGAWTTLKADQGGRFYAAVRYHYRRNMPAFDQSLPLMAIGDIEERPVEYPLNGKIDLEAIFSGPEKHSRLVATTTGTTQTGPVIQLDTVGETGPTPPPDPPDPDPPEPPGGGG